MPELPAMENFRLLVEENCLGRKIASITVAKSKIFKTTAAELEQNLVGQSITETSRYGKYVFVHIGAGWLSFHCGLTGYFEMLAPDDEAVKAKLVTVFEDGRRLAFFDRIMFGRVEWIDRPETLIAREGLGPDAGAISVEDFTAALAASAQPLKGFFLDQSIMAGIGNVYADEILYHDKIHPRIKAKTLDEKAAHRLFKTMGDVLDHATEARASLDNWDMLPSTWLARHRDVGATCPRCKGKIEDVRIAGRHGYFCPTCQPEPAPVPSTRKIK